MNPLRQLESCGQSIWLDFLARRFITDGSLARLVAEDGLKGVTSNPSIFEKAIGHSRDYDEALRVLEDRGDLGVGALYEHLAVADIRAAADVLRPVYEASKGRDGFVSLEVSPYLALATEETVADARRLWREVERPNLMVKVPATPAGIPAIRRLTGEGINVNVTLLFSQQVYEEVAGAYIAGLEDLVARGGDPSAIASVASFFVSRIDTAVDKRLAERLRGSNDEETRRLLEGLRGKVAIANAKLAYRRYKRLFSGPRWAALEAKGARRQRLLWASTGTKNPAYSDVLYVEELIGPDTINTLPPATMDAFRDHGRVRPSLEADLGEAERVMAALERAGIAIGEVTAQLVEEGVRLFAQSFDQLLAAVAQRRRAGLGAALGDLAPVLPDALAKNLAATLDLWRTEGRTRRLWAGDAALWTGRDEGRWLGWLRIVEAQRKALPQLAAIAKTGREDGFRHAVLLGMGGSSLGPEVLAETFGRQPGYPELVTLDSTDPTQIRGVERRLDLQRTLFIVASKSGSTLEPDILQRYFWGRVSGALGAAEAGRRFIAITDPGSQLEKLAQREKFRHVFPGEPTIGGRYSVLSNFGMVPAAIMGLDFERLLAATEVMVRSCAAEVPPTENPAVVLGAILGLAAKSGRDKATILASPGLASFGAWLEQLLAESTGKEGRGIVPVDGEGVGPPEAYGDDRLFIRLALAEEPDPAAERALAVLEAAGHPVVRIVLRDRYQLGQEFFRWEMATAVAGAIVGINPFDQPDVEASKVKTRELTSAYEASGALPPERPFLEEHGVALFADSANAAALEAAGGARSLAGALRAHLARLGPGDYCALLAYLDRSAAHQEALQAMRLRIRDARRVATCLGFGPRFLHSTGQAYKGGPNSGVFLQITCEDGAADLAIPGRKYSFGLVKAAQARGDFDVLAERGRRALRVHLGADAAAGLRRLGTAVRDALA